MASALASEIHHRGAREAAIFVERFIEDMLNTRASDDRDELDKRLRKQLADHCVPNYHHGINVRDLDQKGIADSIFALRTMCKSIKIRVKQLIIDQDGSADMRHARIGFIYDAVIEKEHLAVKKTSSKDSTSSDGSGTHKVKKEHSHHSVEERRTTGLGVAKVQHSKLVSVELAIDTAILKHDPTELGCSIM